MHLQKRVISNSVSTYALFTFMFDMYTSGGLPRVSNFKSQCGPQAKKFPTPAIEH